MGAARLRASRSHLAGNRGTRGRLPTWPRVLPLVKPFCFRTIKKHPERTRSNRPSICPYLGGCSHAPDLTRYPSHTLPRLLPEVPGLDGTTDPVNTPVMGNGPLPAGQAPGAAAGAGPGALRWTLRPRPLCSALCRPQRCSPPRGTDPAPALK